MNTFDLENRRFYAIMVERLRIVSEAAAKEGIELGWVEREPPCICTVSSRPDWLPPVIEATKKWIWRDAGGMAESQVRRDKRRPKKD